MSLRSDADLTGHLTSCEGLTSYDVLDAARSLRGAFRGRNQLTTQPVQGSPSKSFFVDMLTRDIRVSDSILDLMDNSVDSAVAHTGLNVTKILEGETSNVLRGYSVALKFRPGSFELVDTCGGIPAEDARQRVFLLGNPGLRSAKRGLSVYGIGMKRAFFKLGNEITFETQTDSERFSLGIDVRRWLSAGDTIWDFDVPEVTAPRKGQAAGTQIGIAALHEDVSRQFGRKTFSDSLIARIASTYALFLECGLQITVNGESVPSALPEVGGGNTTPARRETSYGDVDVLIVAGVTPKSDRTQRGTYVFCNGRMVLEADRSQLTGWGDLLPKWHSKFGHFVGYLYFESDDVNLLPWTTTKQGVVYEAEVYQKALKELQIQARPVLDFLTRLYPGDVEEAGLAEKEALAKVESAKVSELGQQDTQFRVDVPAREAGDREVSIQFSKKARDVEQLKRCFPRLKSARALGSYAFDYLLKKECR